MDLNDLLFETAGSLRERLADRDIDLVLSLQAVINPFPTRLQIRPEEFADLLRRYVFQPLLDNALDAMPNGGRLTLETRNVEITQADADADPTVWPGTYVLAAVADTGVGYGEAVRERLFEPFFTTKEGRQGLGLARAYGVVRNCGGAIRAASKPGCGATFTVLLPKALS